LNAATADALCETFPTESFIRVHAGEHSDKDYRNYSRPLTRQDGRVEPCDDLSPPWRALIEDLQSLEYRRAIARVFGQTTIADQVELRLVRHATTDFLGPHTDRADKLFSHIVYFNRVWNDQWGGHFEILDADQTVVTRISPALGASVLLERSVDSWHQVARVTEGAASERRSLLIHGRRK